VINVAKFLSVFMFLSPLHGPVRAYLDPGTGSMMLQLVMGGVIGALTLLRVYWRRVLTLFGPPSPWALESNWVVSLQNQTGADRYS
jgi:hypothetical protein